MVSWEARLGCSPSPTMPSWHRSAAPHPTPPSSHLTPPHPTSPHPPPPPHPQASTPAMRPSSPLLPTPRWCRRSTPPSPAARPTCPTAPCRCPPPTAPPPGWMGSLGPGWRAQVGRALLAGSRQRWLAGWLAGSEPRPGSSVCRPACCAAARPRGASSVLWSPQRWQSAWHPRGSSQKGEPNSQLPGLLPCSAAYGLQTATYPSTSVCAARRSAAPTPPASTPPRATTASATGVRPMAGGYHRCGASGRLAPPPSHPPTHPQATAATARPAARMKRRCSSWRRCPGPSPRVAHVIQAWMWPGRRPPPATSTTQ